MLFTQLILGCTMFYCTVQTTTDYVQYTESIASCIDGPQNWYYLKNIRVIKSDNTFIAKVVQEGYKPYYTKCALLPKQK